MPMPSECTKNSRSNTVLSKQTKLLLLIQDNYKEKVVVGIAITIATHDDSFKGMQNNNDEWILWWDEFAYTKYLYRQYEYISWGNFRKK